MMFSQKNKQAWRNPWVIGLIAIVAAGVLINMRMLWNMVHHPTRVLDEHYTVKDHNRYDAKWLQQQAERSTLGWHASLHSPVQAQNDPEVLPQMARFIVTAAPTDFVLELNDKDGKPVEAASIKVDVQWPGDPSFDFKGEFTASTAGRYVGTLNFPRAGNWDLLIHATVNERDFDMEQKVFVAISKP
ncbi:MAG: FixH family protein [Gallionella sp.]